MGRLADGIELRVDLVAGLEALRAARVEATAGRERGGIGQLAAERAALLARRYGLDQRLRVISSTWRHGLSAPANASRLPASADFELAAPRA